MESAARRIVSEKGRRKLVDPGNFIYAFQKEAAKEGRLPWQFEGYQKQLNRPGKVHTEEKGIAHFACARNHTPQATTLVIAQSRKHATQREAGKQNSMGNVVIHAS